MNNLLDILGVIALVAAIAFAVRAARRSYLREQEKQRQFIQKVQREYFQREADRAVTERYRYQRVTTGRWSGASAPTPPRREYLDETIVFVPAPAPTYDEPCRRERYTSGGGGNFDGGGATSSWDSSSSSSSSDSSSSSCDSSSSSSSD